jgi:hypothetical protein
MKTIISMKYIFTIAKQCAELRKKGLIEEADRLEKNMKELVYKCDEVHTGLTWGDL